MSSVEVLKDDEDGLFCLKSAPGTCCPDMNEKQSIDKIGVCLGCGKVYDFKKLKEALLALERKDGVEEMHQKCLGIMQENVKLNSTIKELKEWLDKEIDYVAESIDDNRDMIAEQESMFGYANDEYYDKVKHNLSKLGVLKEVRGRLQ